MPFLSASVSARGASPAFVSGDETISFEALDGAAAEMARKLATLGVKPGDEVAVKGNPDAAVLTSLHGIWKAGGVVLPLNPRWTASEEDRALSLRRPRLLLSGPGVEPPRGDGEQFTLGGEKGGEAPSLESVRPRVEPGPEVHAAERMGQDRIAAVLLTSGTSGTPRGVPLSFGNLLASALGARERLALAPSDRWLASLSLAHVGGMALVSRAALMGCSLLLEGGARAEELAEAAMAGRLTHASLVPTMLYRFLEVWGDRRVPDSLRCFLIGGAPVGEALLSSALDRGFPLALTYGLTEATSQVATAPPELVRVKPGTVGPPLPGLDLSIGPGGEILVRGTTVAPGQADEDGWLHTGDVGHLDSDGHLWVTGRLSHRIISGGVNVDPGEVEALLETHSDVREVAVVGVPDPEWGERVVAAVAMAGPDVRRELEIMARSALSPAKRPRALLRVETLPRNANGKVDREAVRALFAAGQGEA
jgi:O-succinylbenzoic acid--CoA ligase